MLSVCIVTLGAVGARVWEVRVFRHIRCCIFVSCMHPVAVLNSACSLLMLVEDASDHIEEAYSRAGLMTAL